MKITIEGEPKELKEFLNIFIVTEPKKKLTHQEFVELGKNLLKKNKSKRGRPRKKL